MRRPLAIGLALALILLVLAACPTGLLSWSNGPAGNATTNQPGECDSPPYNFVKIHSTLRTIPAQAAGVTDRLWEIDALAELQARVASALSESVREALSARDAVAGQGADAEVASAVGRRS